MNEGRSVYTALVGDQALISVTVKGRPEPVVTWMFKDKVLSTKQNLIIKKEGEKHILEIPNAEDGHMGTYTITAVNDVGQDHKTVTLNDHGE